MHTADLASLQGAVVATHSSVPAWRIPWTEEFSGYSLWHIKGSDTTEVTKRAHHPIPWVSTPSGQPHLSQLTRFLPRYPPTSQVSPLTGVGTRSPSGVCAVNSQG